MILQIYWKLEAAQRFVSCDAGQEYLCIAIESSSKLEEEIRQIIASGKLNTDTSLAEQPKYWTMTNRFNKMPREIILSIAKYLRTWERRELSEAVWPACEAETSPTCCGSPQWKKNWSLLTPFLMTLAEEGSKARPLSYKRLMLWLEKRPESATFKPNRPIRVGTSGTPPWLGMINRKRIWSAIDPVANNYLSVREESDGPMPETEEFAGFIENDERGSFVDAIQAIYYNEDGEKGWRRIVYDSHGEAITKRNLRSAARHRFGRGFGVLA